jgi:hypothetical protein
MGYAFWKKKIYLNIAKTKSPYTLIEEKKINNYTARSR